MPCRRLWRFALLALGIPVCSLLAEQSAPPASNAASAVAAVPAYRQANQVAVLTVQGEIDTLTLKSLERRVRQAVKDGADAVVLDIDTPGGRLDATLDICHLIKTESPVNTVAWINPQAFSAGTIIALACREIVVSPNATFGDAAPIQAGPFGVVGMNATERAKAESPILEEVIDSARRHHYDENLVQAFISVGVELWLIENVQSGERVFVDRAEYERVFGEAPPRDLTPVAPPATDRPVQPRFNTALAPEVAESVDAETRRQRIEFAQSLPPARKPLTEVDRGQWRPLLQVVANDRLLTVKPAEAKFYGLAQATIADDQQLKAHFGAQTIRRYDRSWSEVMVKILTQPVVMGVLIVVFIICLLIELSAPGLGVFGATAAVALLLLIGAPFLAGMAQWWDIMLILVGLLLVLLELFVIPGFGVAGLAGAAALLAGLVGIFVTGEVTSQEGQGELATGLITTLTSLFAAAIGIWLVSRQLNSLPIFDRLILRTEVGDRGIPNRSLLQAMGPGARHDIQPGDVGVAVTDLRPAGRAEFGGRLVDVKSAMSFVDQGTSVRVVSAGKFVIEVEEADG